MSRRTPWLAIAGAKGGVGKTTIAVNLAILAARQGYAPLLVDLDPGLANVDVFLRRAPSATLDDVLCGDVDIEHAVFDGPAGIRVLTGRSGSTRLVRDAAARTRLFAALQRAAEDYDLVVCDTGAGIGPAVTDTLRRATHNLAVTTPDPAAVTDTYALIKLLRALRAPTPAVVFNRVDGRAQALRCAAKLGGVVEQFLGQISPCAGWLSESESVRAATAAQRPFVLDAVPDCAATRELAAVTASALSRTAGLRRATTATGARGAVFGPSMS